MSYGAVNLEFDERAHVDGLREKLVLLQVMKPNL